MKSETQITGSSNTLKLRAAATGALAVGAFAVGALAIGSLAIGWRSTSFRLFDCASSTSRSSKTKRTPIGRR